MENRILRKQRMPDVRCPIIDSFEGALSDFVGETIVDSVKIYLQFLHARCFRVWYHT